MLAKNPQRMDFYKRYQEIIADYNREKDRVTIEETFVIDHVLTTLPQPPYTPTDAAELAAKIFDFVFQQALSGAGYQGQSAA